MATLLEAICPHSDLRPLSQWSDAELDEIRALLEGGEVLGAQKAMLAAMERE